MKSARNESYKSVPLFHKSKIFHISGKKYLWRHCRQKRRIKINHIQYRAVFVMSCHCQGLYMLLMSYVRLFFKCHMRLRPLYAEISQEKCHNHQQITFTFAHIKQCNYLISESLTSYNTRRFFFLFFFISTGLHFINYKEKLQSEYLHINTFK